MKHVRHVVEIARWEFLRYFKWRDVILSLTIVGGVSALTYVFSAWQERSRRAVQLAVISAVDLQFADERFHVDSAGLEREAELRAAVGRGEVDGLLVVVPPAARLVVRKQPAWLGELQAVVSAAMQRRYFDSLGVPPEQLHAALTPTQVQVELADPSARAAGGGLKLAFVLTGIMVLTVFTGIAYLFTGITAEKQDRATEQVFCMTTAQALIDGKLLGVVGLAAVSVLQLLAIGFVVARVFGGAIEVFLLQGWSGVSAGEAAILVAFAVAGILFWLTACAALFATISDPNSSVRSNAVMLPLIPLSAAFLGTGSPDSMMMQVLGWFPLTSMTVMPARVVLSHVPLWQVLGALVLLLAATIAMRRGTGRIYQAGMLMYGKEPSMQEMWRWIRAGR